MRPILIPTAGVKKPVFFVEVEYELGTLNFNSSTHPYTFGGKEWHPVSYLGKIGNVQEVLGVEVGRLSVSLAGIPGTLFQEVASIKYRNKKMRVLMGLVGTTLITTPKTIFTGKVVEYNMVAGPEMGINLIGASNLVTVKKSNVSRYSPADQRIRFPLDKGLEFILNLANMKLQWGTGG